MLGRSAASDGILSAHHGKILEKGGTNMGFFARVGKVKVYSTKKGPKASISKKKKKGK